MSKKASSKQEGELQVAHRRIESFGKRFGQAHLVFACHAAFPLALTPDLLYCLWANFQCDIKGRVLEIPWIAVADLLVSGLLSEVGYETYQMDRVVRNLLLNDLEEDENFGQQRISELAQFLLAFVQPQLKSDDPDLRDFALAQRWTALAYTQPTEAVRQLAKAYRVSLESGTELVRMESLVKTLAQPLAEFQPLLIYASSLGNFARGKLETAAAQLREVPKKGNAIEVAGVNLLIPKQIQTPLWQQKAESPTLYKPQRLPAPANMVTIHSPPKKSERSDIERYTRIEFPSECILQQKVDLRIQLVVQTPAQTRVLQKVSITTDIEVKEVTLYVHITASGFTMQQRHKPLILPVNGDSEEIIFKLVPVDLGEQVVEIEFFHQGSRVGYVLVKTNVKN